jgi:hypothetical protein
MKVSANRVAVVVSTFHPLGIEHAIERARALRQDATNTKLAERVAIDAESLALMCREALEALEDMVNEGSIQDIRSDVHKRWQVERATRAVKAAA